MLKNLIPNQPLISLIFILFCFVGKSQTNAYHISGEITNCTTDVAYLSMMYGDNQYVVDTADIVQGKFVFEGPLKLRSGVYLVVLPPTKSFFVLIDSQDEENFSLKGNCDVLTATVSFEGSSENTRYYDYLRFFEGKRGELDRIKSDYELHVDDQDRLKLLADMQTVKQELTAYQRQLVAANPGTLTAAIVRCELITPVPDFEGTQEENQVNKYKFYKNHYFDNIDLVDDRLIRAPEQVMISKVEIYLDKLTVHHPDSIISSVDMILDRCAQTQDSYRFFLTHFFNKYRDAKSIGMDAIYVHIATQYIAKGKAPWIDEATKKQLLAAVQTIEPTLIGKKAPKFQVQKKDGSDLALYDITSPFTVLFFWAPNCTHCQKSMPLLDSFYDQYRSMGVELLAVCTKLNQQEAGCWDYLDKYQFNKWINASDQKSGNSSVLVNYNIRNTPKIFVLDKNKTIVAKDIGVESLAEVMNRLLGTPNN